MTDFLSREELDALPTVEMAEIGGGVIMNDMIKDVGNVDIAELPEIAQIAYQVVQSMDIPNSAMAVFQSDDGHISIARRNEAFFEQDRSTVFLTDQDVKLEGASSHRVSTEIQILPQEDGGYKVQVGTSHDGSYDNNIDASYVGIAYDVDADGNFTGRNGYASTEDFNGSILDQEHGTWAIDAAQTLEHRLATALGSDGPNAKEDILSQRPESAATEVGQPPGPENATSLSSLDLQAMASSDAAPDKPAPAETTPATAPAQGL